VVDGHRAAETGLDHATGDGATSVNLAVAVSTNAAAKVSGCECEQVSRVEAGSRAGRRRLFDAARRLRTSLVAVAGHRRVGAADRLRQPGEFVARARQYPRTRDSRSSGRGRFTRTNRQTVAARNSVTHRVWYYAGSNIGPGAQPFSRFSD